MKQAEIKELSTNELREKLVLVQSDYTKMKMGHAVSPIENPMKIRATRRAIARINTELQVRTMQENNQ